MDHLISPGWFLPKLVRSTEAVSETRQVTPVQQDLNLQERFVKQLPAGSDMRRIV